jgi:galactose mutarotase-like enzyme
MRGFSVEVRGVIEVVNHRGWDLHRLRSDLLQVDVVPGKGGDILSVRWLPTDLELLWQSPWGLRQRGALPTGADSGIAVLEAYPGGWQTMFPNVGAATVEQGVLWPVHGEVWVAPFDVAVTGPAEITMVTRLVRSPFTVRKTIRVDAASVEVTETVTNHAGASVDVAWGHHPAFTAPLISAACRLDIPGHAICVDVDDKPAGDLIPESCARWPMAAGRDGMDRDLREVPGAGAGVNRLLYVSELDEGLATLTNPDLGLQVSLSWDHELMPYVWVFTECHASAGFPWYEAVHVFAIEPHTSAPCQGLAAIREQTGSQLAIEAGESRTTSISLRVSQVGG